MLSGQTRNEVRAPFRIGTVSDAVKQAQLAYLELHPKVMAKYQQALQMLVLQLGTVSTLASGKDPKAVVKQTNALLNRFSVLRETYRFDHAKSYEETLHFLSQVQGETINLSQHEYLALSKDDEALRNLRVADSQLDEAITGKRAPLKNEEEE